MDRRKFLSTFFGGVAALAAVAAIDPDVLSWEPGAKAIFLPPPVRLATSAEGIAIRFVKNYDIYADRFPSRLDVLYGMAVCRPELAFHVSDIALTDTEFASQYVRPAAKAIAEKIDSQLLAFHRDAFSLATASLPV